jgi:hypothetical protein
MPFPSLPFSAGCSEGHAIVAPRSSAPIECVRGAMAILRRDRLQSLPAQTSLRACACAIHGSASLLTALFSPHCCVWLPPIFDGGHRMTRTMATAVLTLTLLSSAAVADDHRGGDAALGALSGAVVLGPVGAVAGAVVGYTAGPSIARSWGFRRTRAARQGGRPAREARAEVPLPKPRSATSAEPPAPAAPPAQTLE